MASADTMVMSEPPSGAFVFDKASSVRLEASITPQRPFSVAGCRDDRPPVSFPDKTLFQPDSHLQFEKPAKVYTMTDLGLPANTGVSPVAVSEPFQLFTAEAVERIRAEILSKSVWENCQYSSNLSQCQLRGFAPDYAPFVYDAWKSPETLAIISQIAGIDLVPQMDFEIGHVNISMQTEEQKRKSLAAAIEAPPREGEAGGTDRSAEDDKPIVDWHTDSYPFVCVTMLSDCTNMIGGETALRTGHGDIMKVRGPGKGCAVVLQGRYIEHQALRALGSTERITMVTSFRPKSVISPDDTVLTTVRPVSDLPELYYQYSEYRLELLEERLRKRLKTIQEQKRAHRGFNTGAMKTFLKEQEEFLATMNREMVDESQVTKGVTDESHLLSPDLKSDHRAKTQKIWS